MPNAVACYKWVVDEADIRVADDLSVDFSRAKKKISDYDRNAIEVAVQAAAAMGGAAIGVTFGDASVQKSVKEALARGLDEAFWVVDDKAADADGRVTAEVLAAQIKNMPDVGIVVCSDGSSDMFARQTAPRIAAILDWPCVTSVMSLEVTDGTVTARRKLESDIEVVEVAMPCVISVQPEIAEAPIPGLKQIMAAGKKPNERVEASGLGADFAAAMDVAEEKGFAMARKNVVLEGETAEVVSALIESLRKEGVL